MKKLLYLITTLTVSVIVSLIGYNAPTAQAWNQQYSVPNCSNTLRNQIPTNLQQVLEDSGISITIDTSLVMYTTQPNTTYGGPYTQIRVAVNNNEDISFIATGGYRQIRLPEGTRTSIINGSSSTGSWSVWSTPTASSTSVTNTNPHSNSSDGCLLYQNNVERGQSGSTYWTPSDVPSYNFNIAPDYDDIIQVPDFPLSASSSNGSREVTFNSIKEVLTSFTEVDRNLSSGFCTVMPSETYDLFINAINNKHPFIITYLESAGDNSTRILISILKNKSDPVDFNWVLGGQDRLDFITSSNGLITATLRVPNATNDLRLCYDSVLNTSVPFATSSFPGIERFYPLLTNVQIDYPQNYNGEIVPVGEAVLDKLKPEFFYKVNEEGLFTIEYAKNIKPFLTGTFYTNLDKMNTNWNGLDYNVTQFVSVPAGAMKETYTLPVAGYYLINISHNQQLDNPPWDNDNYSIEQIFMQFYWDGITPISGNNINCSASELCNPWRKPEIDSYFGIDFNTYGLTSAIYAPLDFIATLPSKMASSACEPLVLPLPYMDEDLVIPCLRPVYETHFAPIYNLYSVILTGLVTYYFAVNIFARLKKDSSPNDDSIEVAKL